MNQPIPPKLDCNTTMWAPAGNAPGAHVVEMFKTTNATPSTTNKTQRSNLSGADVRTGKAAHDSMRLTNSSGTLIQIYNKK